MTLRVARQEMSKTEQVARITMLQQTQGFQFAVQEHLRSRE